MLAAIAFLATIGAADMQASPLRVLVFSKTAGFRHDSIPAGQEMLRQICEKHGWIVRFTEDASWFEPHTLARYDVALFLCTTQDVLNEVQERAFVAWFRSGKGFVGVHAASDTEYGWEWYGRLVGAYFASHPQIQKATIRVEDRSHPATKHLPVEWVRTDEWYNYRANPRPNVRVLATLDESTYQGGTMGADHPIIWCHEFEGGRSWYTGLGHTKETYAEPLFVTMITEAIRWAAGRT